MLTLALRVIGMGGILAVLEVSELAWIVLFVEV